LSHKHLPIPTVVPIHCELQLSTSSCSKEPFFVPRISPYLFFNVLASFQLTLSLLLVTINRKAAVIRMVALANIWVYWSKHNYKRL